MHRQRVRLGAWMGAIALIVLTLTGCAQGAQNQASARAPGSAPTTPMVTPSPTEAPFVAPALHTMSLGGYKAGVAQPGAAGMALVPALPTSLAFYRYSTKAVEQIATAPAAANGVATRIVSAAYSGDWLSYITADQQMSQWNLWAYNVATGERIQVDSEAKEAVFSRWLSPVVANGSDLVWALNYSSQTSGTTSQMTAKLRDFSYATRQTQTLYTESGQLLTPLAMNDSAILFTQADNSGNAPTYLLQRGATAPKRISTLTAHSASMNARYAVWDDAHTGTTTLYDLASGVETRGFAPCMQPVIAQTYPYMVCMQSAPFANVLVRVPDGVRTTYNEGQPALGNSMRSNQIYGGRAFFVTPDGAVEYLDLSAQ